MTIKKNLRTFVKTFGRIVCWILDTKYEMKMGKAFAGFPDAGIVGSHKEESKELSWLLVEFIRLDMVDGEADSLRRLKSWLRTEIDKSRTRTGV
jgi:hypothetical protein